MKQRPKRFFTAGGIEGAYLGEDLAVGPRPAFVYLSLSADESLTLSPYNSPIAFFQDSPARIFSYTIPGHEEGKDKFKAIHSWAENPSVLEFFLSEVAASLSTFIEKGVIDPEKLAAGGLSRGGFLATHLAAREKRIGTVLGFSPITRLGVLETFKGRETDVFDLEKIVTELELKRLRFYIGNHDTQVSTDACYAFVRHLAEHIHEKRSRHTTIELYIKQSIGMHGHGTAPETFEEGSLWVKSHL